MHPCPFCAASAPSVSRLLAHIRMMHTCDPGFHIQCGLQGCQRTFRNFYTYRNHVYAMHVLDSENSTSTDMDATDGTTDNYFGAIEPMVTDDTDHTQVANEVNSMSSSNITSTVTTCNIQRYKSITVHILCR